MLTEEQKRKYLNHDSVCLYCGSYNIDAMGISIEDGQLWQHVECSDCHKSWRDIYRLVDVEEETEDEEVEQELLGDPDE